VASSRAPQAEAGVGQDLGVEAAGAVPPFSSDVTHQVLTVSHREGGEHSFQLWEAEHADGGQPIGRPCAYAHQPRPSPPHSLGNAQGLLPCTPAGSSVSWYRWMD
jgi:hypothetical protein